MASNSFKVKNSLVLTPKDLSTLTNPEAGDLACDINDSNKIKRYDENAASWVEVGSGGGVGGVDIFFVQDFESASLSSFDSQVGLSLSQTDPLKGRVSALLTHDSSVDQLFKQVIPVDAKFRGIPMVLRLDSKSSASQGNLVIKIYDETNLQDIVASEQLQLSDEVSGKKTSISFTIPESCESLSYTITALPESGSPVSRIDDIICEIATSSLLETAVEVPVVTDWQSYTPTSLNFGGFGTVTNFSGKYRQIGDSIEVTGFFICGTVGAARGLVKLPNGFNVGLNKITSFRTPVGQIENQGGFALPRSLYVDPADGNIYMGVGESGGLNTGTLDNRNVNTFFGTGTPIGFKFSVPCTGLLATTTKTIPLTQSGLIQEADSVLNASGNSGQSITANVTDIPFNLQRLSGSDFSYNGASLTVLKAGVVSLDFCVSFTTQANRRILLYKNGVFSKTLSQTDVTSGNNAGNYCDYFEAGDIISLRCDTSSTLSNSSPLHYFTITKQGSLKQVNINPESKITIPTSELRMEGASSRGSTATTIVRFDNIAKIRGDAFEVVSNSVDGTYVRMKKAGILDISASVSLNASSGVLHISQNQLVLTAEPTQNESRATSFTYSANSSTNLKSTFSVAANDLIRVAANTGVIDNGRNKLLLSFQEQDISVSVSNVLPQFSEGDSSVRVDTANGYGSVGTKIRRFSNVRDNLGNDIQYVPSATDGDSFVVQSDGIYHISYTDNTETASGLFGISKNASSINSDIDLLSASEILALQQVDGSFDLRSNSSWQGYLSKGDIIRAHNRGTSALHVGQVSFTISKVGKPNITSVDVTPFVNVPQPESEVITHSAGGNTLLDNSVELRFNSSNLSSTNKGIIKIEDDPSNTRTKFVALKKCTIDISACVTISTPAYVVLRKNGVNTLFGSVTNAVGQYSTISGQISLEAGEFLTLFVSAGTASTDPLYLHIAATAQSDQLLTPSDTFSTDTAPLTYAPSSQYTLSTLENAPVGTFITFTYAANTNTRTQTTTAPSQSTADMNQNGIQIFTRAFNVASTAASPATVAIQIGKGMKGHQLNLYKNAGKSLQGFWGYLSYGAFNDGYGGSSSYNEKTGILTVDAGIALSSSESSRLFLFNDASTQNNGYLTINAGKTLPLLAIPTPKVAYLKDVKPSGTAGGTFTSGAWQTRTLNTVEGDTSFVTLNANQFTLPAGKYEIEATAPTNSTNGHKAKLRNITDSSDSIIGTNGFSGVAANMMTVSLITGTVNILSPKTFEIQHRCQTTRASDGFGFNNSYDAVEVYAQVKITKLS